MNKVSQDSTFPYLWEQRQQEILLQLPLGYLSDRFERRKVILMSCFVLAIVSFGLPVSIIYNLQILALLLVALIMGFIACLYPLSIAETLTAPSKLNWFQFYQDYYASMPLVQSLVRILPQQLRMHMEAVPYSVLSS